MPDSDRSKPADVCLILEGSYPFVHGGVSTWTQDLIAGLPDLSFEVLAIESGARRRKPKYTFPPNVVGFSTISIDGTRRPGSRPPRGAASAGLDAGTLAKTFLGGDLSAFARFVQALSPPGAAERVLDRHAQWTLARDMVDVFTPGASFLQFFYTWSTVFTGLVQCVSAPLPRARCYHAITTGFAGLVAARARLQQDARIILTEHGIYTNERRIDLMLSSDLHESFLDMDEDSQARRDIRDLLIEVFESFARLCYASCDDIVALSGIGQREQRLLGADPARTLVIPNGIDPDRFATVRRKDPGQRVAFIGRVVPIKDVETFIRAAGLVRERLPDVEALVVGPTDEDPAYHRRCVALTRDLGLSDCVTFTGRRKIEEIFAEVDVVVLTSLSESQPLILLEAGAAGLPCVSTDVGAAREMLEGAAREIPPLGPGGIVTGLLDPVQTADAICRLLEDPDLARRFGETQRQRVGTYYRQIDTLDTYRGLYSSGVRSAHFRELAWPA
ncbi:GT4 family glycosyltransferase PelF [Histidinibacterium aquaticum]|uniref:DUF3492 domain-containing protein n=1 Tax=Histidinibacterium aquaticum TaxID=2613962 RepID=A0A5J5GPI2_9RHOB|nr:GT4 family glycosyltransferase PelF [Histidinibacterium aquaticum]KAA9009434.1 DUF3492 domain-containing protein [Histidinibacterium aquaticum]